jgi:hypothetical protein
VNVLTDWSAYAACGLPRCQGGVGQPCSDLRARRAYGERLPHARRPHDGRRKRTDATPVPLAREDAVWETVEPPLSITEGGQTHLVHRARAWVNPHAAAFLDWEAPCGVTGTWAGTLAGARSFYAPPDRVPRAMRHGGCWS